MKRWLIIMLLGIFSTGILTPNILAQDITVAPQSFNINLNYGETTTETLTINNTSGSSVDFTVEGLKTNILALTNSVDVNFEYQRTLDALDFFYDNYELSEINTQEASELATALVGQNVLLIVHQEACDVTAFEGFADVLQTYANNGGTIIFTGATKSALGSTYDSACLFATGLLEGSFIGNITSAADLTVNLPDEAIVENVENPYELDLVTYTYNITNDDAIRVVSYEGEDVIVRREIGAGQVILIAHNYLNDSNNTRRIIANAVRSAGGVEWLSTNTLAGTIDGSTYDLALTFDGNAVYGGVYQADLVIATDAGNVTVPITLTITGIPGIQTNTIILDFEEWLVGATVTQQFTIENTGTDSLFITDIVSDNADYTVDITSASLYAEKTIDVTVTYMPSAIETDVGALSIFTNASANPTIISLNGEGLGGSLPTPNPAAIEVTLNSGESTTETLTINNPGAGPLDFEIVLGPGSNTNNLLVHVLGMDDQLSDNTIGVIENSFPEFTITTTETTDIGEFQTLLTQNKMLLLPRDDFTLQNMFNANPEILDNFLSTGGVVLFITSINIANATGVFDGINANSFNGEFLVTDPHPMNEGLASSYPDFNFTANAVEFTGDYTSTLDYDGYYGINTIAAYTYPVQGGLAAYLGLNYFTPTNENETILINTMGWLNENALPDWITFTPTTATDIGFPDGSVEIEVTLNSEGLLGGTYETTLILLNNGPVPTLEIPITMVVVGVPAVELEVTSIDFGNVVIGNTPNQTFTIFNPGTDSLFVTSITTEFGDEYTFDNETITVPPLSEADINLVFDPSTPGDYTTTITIENNVETQTIELTGIGISAPEFGIDPESLAVTLLAGSDTTTTLSISNTGAGPLAYFITGEPIDVFEIVTITNAINIFSYPNLLTSIESLDLNYNLTEYNGTDGSELAAILNNAQVLVVPTFDSGLANPATIANFAAAIQNFTNNGGLVIVTGNDCTDCINALGLFNTTLFNYTASYEPHIVVLPDSPLANGLPESYTQVAFNWIFQNFDNATTVVTGTDYGLLSGPILAYNNIGGGNAVYLGFNYNGIDPNADLMLSNAINWNYTVPDWLSISNFGETVAADGGTFDVDITIDATGLLAGTYTYDMIIQTNDPLNPTVLYPITLVVEAFPQAVFVNNPLSCDGFAAFTDLSVNDPTSWAWDFGDGNTATDQNPTHNYEDNGTYDITLEVCNDLGCDNITGSIVVDFTASFCDTILMPSTGNLTLNSCTGVLFDPGGDAQYPNSMSGTVTIAPPGASEIILQFASFEMETNFDYIEIYDGENTNGTLLGFFEGNELPGNNGEIIANTGAVTIFIFSDGVVTQEGFETTWQCLFPTDPPIPNFSGTSLSCDGYATFFDESLGGANAWTWDFGNGETSTEENPTVFYEDNGEYTVSLEVCNDIGCSDISSMVTVDLAASFCDTLNMPQSGEQLITACTGVLLDSGGDNNYLPNTNSTITIAPPNAVQLIFTFSFIDLQTNSDYIEFFNGPDASGEYLGFYDGTGLPNGDGIIIAESGALTVHLVTDGFGESSGFEATWECISPTVAPTPAFTNDIIAPCEGEIAFLDQSENFPSSWLWDFGDGNTSTEQSPVHFYEQNGTYTVTLETCNAVGCETITEELVLADIFLLDIDFNYPIPLGIPHQFTDNTAGAISWEWNFGNGAGALDNPTPTVTYFQLGNYDVEVTISNGTCTSTETFTVAVAPVGIDDINENTTLNIYPNPTDGMLQIDYQFEGNRNLQLQVFDAIGRQVHQQKANAFNGFNHQLNLANFAKGVYMLSITSEEGTARKQIVIQ